MTNKSLTCRSSLCDLDWLLAEKIVAPGNPDGRFWRYSEGAMVFDTSGCAVAGKPWRPTENVVDAMTVEAALSKQNVGCKLSHFVQFQDSVWRCDLYWAGKHSVVATGDSLPLALCRAAKQYLFAQNATSFLDSLLADERVQE